MQKQQLDEILRKHGLWLNDENGGEQADLSSADLSSANLRSANLRSADLSYADLSYADLRSADLRSAKNIIVGPPRVDGYQFFLIKQKSSWHVIAGCRDMTIKEYRKHLKTYHDDAKEAETGRILDFLEGRLEDIA